MSNNHRLTNSQGNALRSHFPKTQALVDFGNTQGWTIQPLGRAPLPERPVHLGQWLVVPAEQDTTPVPDRSMERIQALFAAGFRPKGFVVVHEAPPLLPEKVGESLEEIHISTWSPASRQLAKRLKTAVGIGAVGAITLPFALTAAVVAITGIAMILAPLLLVTGALALDPILVAVTEEDVWVEIDRWWVE